MYVDDGYARFILHLVDGGYAHLLDVHNITEQRKLVFFLNNNTVTTTTTSQPIVNLCHEQHLPYRTQNRQKFITSAILSFHVNVNVVQICVKPNF